MQDYPKAVSLQVQAALYQKLAKTILASWCKSYVPFYDRSGLIHETLGTLNSALKEENLVTVVMVAAMLLHFSSSLLISCLLPFSVLICFIFMKYLGVDANIVALSGIAIAIGTLDDMGVVMCENILCADHHVRCSRVVLCGGGGEVERE